MIKNKSGQVTIFIIIAIVLVVGLVAFFVLRGAISKAVLPASIEPVYNSFTSCVEESALIGIDILESQGGYISLPDFEPGSQYFPFSSQLNFLGNPIPYWDYVSGNSIQKEQVPSKSEMEDELAEFIDSKARECSFVNYYDQGFVISEGEPKSKVIIRDNEVEVNLNMDLNIEKEEDSAQVNNHKVIVKSKLGSLYDSAKKVYDYEKGSLFLENYAVDTLRLYAPVDGVELTCSPMIWNADDVFDELQNAIEANTLALRTRGGDFDLKKKENKYFIVDVSVDADVRFVNSKNWANSFEVAPSEESILMSTPVGNQPGLGILGFCYVPYHFVYNMKYPVLVQVSSGDEIFQFPLGVVIQGNKPRESLDSSASQIPSPELCKYKNTLVNVNVYDNNLNSVDADISYECFGEVCSIGKAEQGYLAGNFPQCVNGYVLARAEGFADSKNLYSVTGAGSMDIVLDRVYDKTIELKLDGAVYSKNAIVTFVSDAGSKTIVYPEQKSVKLSEGQYEIQVYVYRDSSLKLQKTSYEQCVEVPESGIGGLFGFSKEKCFDVEIPAQIVSNVLAGGGKENYYILESELKSQNVLEINAESLDVPKSLEELQNNYVLFEGKELEVMFR